MQVDEPQSCEYILTIGTSKICTIPKFRPAPVRKQMLIECRPTLSQAEHAKYQDLLKAKEAKALAKAEANKIKEREKLIKALDDVDISHIDVESDEGLDVIEGMVGEKLADKLVGELGAIFGLPKAKRWIQPEHPGGRSFQVQDVKLASGEMQSRIMLEKNQLDDIIKDLKTKSKKKANLDPRSDLSDTDEMMEELVQSMKSLRQDQRETYQDLKGSIEKNLEDSLEDIVEETEAEMKVKLDGMQRHQALEELYTTLKDVLSKLDKAEEDISKVNEEIENIQEKMVDKEEELDTLKKELIDFKDDQDDLDDILEQPKVNIKVTNLAASTTALKDSPSEKRVIKHLERSIKDKLAKAGLDTGGRQIEVKFITTSIPAEVFGGSTEAPGDSGEAMSQEEAKQFQGMIYNLMVGNQEAYEDIDNQRRAEKSYHFSLDDNESESEEKPEENPMEDPKENPEAL